MKGSDGMADSFPVQSGWVQQRDRAGDPIFRNALAEANGNVDRLLTKLYLATMMTENETVRDSLSHTASRVSAIVRARKAKLSEQDLKAALKQLVENLAQRAEGSRVLLSCDIADDIDVAEPVQVSTVKLIVNELATNAIDHAFAERASGTVTILAHRDEESRTVIVVDDDGLPFPELDEYKQKGIGFDLVKTLARSIDAEIVFPSANDKRFEIRLPATPN